MEKSFIVIALVGSLFSCGFPSVQRRIYGGQTAKDGEFPYIVNIWAGRTTCGGALINDKFILTAAHCLMYLHTDDKIKTSYKEGFDIIRVVLGDRYFWPIDESGVKIHQRMKFWIHKDFEMPSAVNDIAMIQLPGSVKFTEKIQPLKISSDPHVDSKNQEAITVLAGFGLIEGKKRDNILRHTKLKLIPIESCYQYQPNFIENITKDHICAFGDSKQAGPCDGDSGSPLVLQSTHELIGITSFVKDEDGITNDCGSNSAPSVYVRAASYLDWISEKTGIRFD